MGWKLKVSGYGKIENAEIEMAPLTLFVGDNNSGKSYLMSLLWGIQNFGMTELMNGGYKEGAAEEKELTKWFRKQITVAWERGIYTVGVSEISSILQSILDKGLKRNKNRLVRKIFNSDDLGIEKLQIELKDLDEVSLHFVKVKDPANGKKGMLSIRSNYENSYMMSFWKEEVDEIDELLGWEIVNLLLGLVMNIDISDMGNVNNEIYLPAARTGFMLTKDIVNKVGRNTVFNINMQESKITPFVRPINQFLDVMNDLAFDSEGDEKFKEVTAYLENGMAEGLIEMSTLPNREVLYVPEGLESGIPLRVVSAVVTELSPLILILKHKKNLKTLFYEEPEMCLHPQLQQKMARVICQLVNTDLRMIVTTHSDIILQHINNMIRLSEREDIQELCSQFGYNATDMLNAENVRVYQLKSENGEKTKVEEIVCGKNGFAIPTFNEALDKIMDEAYSIQE